MFIKLLPKDSETIASFVAKLSSFYNIEPYDITKTAKYYKCDSNSIDSDVCIVVYK